MRRFLSRLRAFFSRRPLPPKRTACIQYRDEQGRERVGRIVGVAGFYLDVRPVESSGVQARLLSAEEAADSELFWQQWKAWGGERLFFEDGTPYEPWSR